MRYGLTYHESNISSNIFMGYVFETNTFILNITSAKSVQKTPYEIWIRKCPSLSFLMIWDCDTYVKHQVLDKLAPKYDKCLFVVYP